ncbi:MAG: MATE family efflux transporter [Clostridia bacterium]|nr:MATE family efflux transporter [Clostridia bacterium]
MIQNGITNFVNMLDNIMIGRIGTAEMTGVAVSNQLIFVFNLCIFGAVSGAGIFCAQFYGNGDHNGVRQVFRYKLIFSAVLAVLGIGVFLAAGDPLISLYLKGEGDPAAAAASLARAGEYVRIMLIGLVPYAIAQCYSSTLREIGKPMLPMVAGLIAVFVNLIGNYILIFGKFGAPALGVRGAAIATVASRFVELAIVVVWTRLKAKENPFIIGAYRSLYVPWDLVKRVTAKGLPLMLNEGLWSAGIAMLNQGYSERGLNVVAATNISQTFWNVFAIAFMAVGAAIGIILGQLLGAGKEQQAKEQSYKLITSSVLISALMALLFGICAEWIPQAYNTTPEIRHMATRLMQIGALAMPIDAFAHATYFTMRSGGKTLVTFLFDSAFVWAVNVPTVLLLTRCTDLSVLWIFAVIQFSALIKCVIGFILVKKGIWIKNIISNR